VELPAWCGKDTACSHSLYNFRLTGDYESGSSLFYFGHGENATAEDLSST
jgi:hypothetical protein